MAESVLGTANANPLWSLPLPSGAPRRLGGTLGRDGEWSPDGRQLLFFRDSDIYQGNADGTDPHKLLTVQGKPFGLFSNDGTHISPDGTHIRFTIQRPDNSNSLWEIRSDGSNLHPVLPGWHSPPSECCGAWTPDGRYYFFLNLTPSGANVWAVREPSGLFHRHSSAPFQLTTGPLSFESLVPSADGKKLFVSARQGRGELVRYDPKSKQFVPFLAGISAGELDFSRDGKWVTYVSYPVGITN